MHRELLVQLVDQAFTIVRTISLYLTPSRLLTGHWLIGTVFVIKERSVLHCGHWWHTTSVVGLQCLASKGYSWYSSRSVGLNALSCQTFKQFLYYFNAFFRCLAVFHKTQGVGTFQLETVGAGLDQFDDGERVHRGALAKQIGRASCRERV